MFPPLNSTVQQGSAPLPDEEDVAGNLSYETRVKAARYDQLRAAAQAVCDRWDSRDWGKLEHTGDYIRRLRFALDYDAAATAPAGGVTPQDELDPRTALEHARSMTRYVQSFNGQTFSPALDSVDRQNLATALDNLEETAAMLLNMADRTTAARAAEPTDAELEKDAARWREHASKLDALVTYCPTCCTGFTAKPEMTRDEVIFECGKTAGRSESRALPAASPIPPTGKEAP